MTKHPAIEQRALSAAGQVAPIGRAAMADGAKSDRNVSRMSAVPSSVGAMSDHSPELDKLAAALVQVQANLTVARADAEAWVGRPEPRTSYCYATLNI